jgi:hypothetical protein
MTKHLLAVAVIALCAYPHHAHSQHSAADHSAHLALRDSAVRIPTQPGQAAYAALAEVVRLLEADSSTDWRRVNLAALREHLIDMDEVVMHARIRQDEIAGGARIEFTGEGSTLAAVQRMATAHAAAIDGTSGLSLKVERLSNGVRWDVISVSRDDGAIARIRGLGGIGLLTLGDHHARHHLAIARGESMDAHSHER